MSSPYRVRSTHFDSLERIARVYDETLERELALREEIW